MNILLVSPWPLDFAGGVTVVVQTLGDSFLKSGDHPVYLIPADSDSVQNDASGRITTYRLKMRAPKVERAIIKSRIGFLTFFPTTCWRLYQILQREKVDIVNIHYFSPASIYFIYLRVYCRFRLALSVHGSDVLGSDGAQNIRRMERYHRWIDRVIFCSGAFRDQVLSKSSALYSKSTVIRNAISSEELPLGYSRDAGRDYVVCVAHLRHHKGQDVLLRAFQRISYEFPTLELDLVGDGPFAPFLNKLATELGIESKVNFVGIASREQCLIRIRQAKVMCLPSRREPFGLVLLESMALGTPVVATLVGGIPEVIRDGVDGILVPPDDEAGLANGLRRLLSEAALRENVIRNGASRVQEAFTVRRFSREYRDQLSALSSAKK